MRTELRDNETLMLETRRHWMVLMPAVFGLLACLSMVYLFLFVYPSQKFSFFLKIAEMALGVSGGVLIYKYYAWKADIWAVTNTRIINEWGVFTRNVKESPLDKINNVSFTQPLLGMFLNFGDVEVQTAAEQGATIIKFVVDPENLQTTVVRCQEEYKSHPAPEHGLKSGGKKENAGADTRECPYCAETIKAKASICRFCNKEVAVKSNLQPIGG
ncbi:MAG: PH domain-containing protein [Deltaproteobacteria bacterium]|nr:PH domain-containing protein [Deltaproteobacteria bacterium]